MDHLYQNALEESNTHLTDFKGPEARHLLEEKGFYKILWTREKTVGITIDACPTDLQKNQVLFCTPLHQLFIPKEAEGVLAIIFNREFFCIRDHEEEVSCNGFLFYGSAQPVVVSLNEKEAETIGVIYDIFLEEFKDMEKSHGEMVRAMLKRLIIKGTRLALKQQHKEHLPAEKYDLIRKLHLLVEKNFKTKHMVSHYADMLCKSPKTLTNVCRKYGEPAPLQIINERIVLGAKRLLIFSHQTVEEIAFELGFKEAAHFSHFFKKHTGRAPLPFRKASAETKKREQ